MTFVEFLDNLQSTLVVRYIATVTPQLRTASPSEGPEAAQAIMKRGPFDILPVEDGESISRYYERQDHDPPCLKEVVVADIVGADLSLLEVIRQFAESGREFYLVLGGSRIDGIVTRADLNEPAVRVLIYAILNRFELLLGGVVEGRYKDARCLALLSRHSREKAQQRLVAARSKNMVLRPTAYLNLSDLVTICAKTQNTWRTLGVNSKRELTSHYAPLAALRNKIAHPVRPLVSASEDVPELWEQIATAVGAVSRLEQGLHSSQ